jgi:hypothetical protein
VPSLVDLSCCVYEKLLPPLDAVIHFLIADQDGTTAQGFAYVLGRSRDSR